MQTTFQHTLRNSKIMTREDIYQQIITIISDLFDIPKDKIEPTSNLYEDLDLDSIDAVDLVVQLRNTTKQDIQPSVFKQVRTINDVVDVIDDLLNK